MLRGSQMFGVYYDVEGFRAFPKVHQVHERFKVVKPVDVARFDVPDRTRPLDSHVTKWLGWFPVTYGIW